MAIEIEDSPVIKMAAHGYTPFTPDAGIFCGGYQGPLYPNPTTFLTILDLREFLNPVIDEYTMKSTPDFYEGLGSGNPGINYRNAGHIIGLLDTFSRMSYGLRVLQATREASTDTSFGPAVGINIPFATIDGDIKQIGDIDLYPALAEIPTDYLSSFIAGNGFLILDPRVDDPFIFNSNIHSPLTNLISEAILREFFAGVLTDSFREMPQVFHSLYEQLFQYTQINSFSTKQNTTISQIPVGRSISDIPLPLDFCLGFPTQADPEIKFLPNPGPDDQGTFAVQYNPVTITESLKILGGDGEFHFGLDGIHRHDTFTELNSVVNLVPIQAYGYKYKYFMDMHHPKGDSENFFLPNWYVIYSIVDINLNICSLLPQTISIAGTVKSEDLVTGIELYHVCRQLMFTTSVTNEFTWDRIWFANPDVDRTTFDSTTFLSSSPLVPTLGPDAPIGEIFANSTTLNFSETVSLDEGNNIVRGRIIAQTIKLHENIGSISESRWDDLSTELNITGDNFEDIDYSFNFS